MRIIMWLAIGYGAACVIGAYSYGVWLWWLGVVLSVLSIAGLLISLKYGKLRTPAVVCYCMAAGMFCFLIYDGFWLEPVRLLDAKIQDITVECADYSYNTDYGSAVDGRIHVDGRDYQILLYLNEAEELEPGDRIEGTFRLRFTTAGALEEPTYHRGEGTFLLGYQVGELMVTECEQIPIQYYPALLRHSLIDIINRAFPRDTAFFARALLLGDRSDVDYETSTAFKITGISHIIAVSGLHVSILFSLIYLITGKRRILTAIVGIPLVLAFMAVAGFTPSVTRAGVMQILVMLAMLVDKEYDPPTALGFAAMVMMLVNPLVVTSASFQLSVGCMAGIFLSSVKIGEWIVNLRIWRNWKGKSFRVRFRQWFAGGVSVTLASMFFTTPLVANYFGTVSLIGTVTNLLTLWAVTLIFYGVMLVCLVFCVWAEAGVLLGWLVAWLIRYVLAAAKVLSAFPLAALYTESVYIVFWLVLCYVLITWFLIAKKGRPHVLICCTVLGLCIALGCSWIEPMLDQCRMTVLDVGQGQCILLQAEGRSYLVDCGGDSDAAAADKAAEILLSQGITRLDGVIVTHYDRDHAGGVGYLLSRIPTDAVFLPVTMDEEDITGRIMMFCRGNDIWVTEDLILSWGSMDLTIFAPVMSGSDNESGLCVLFRQENCDILITGDLGTVGERVLLETKQIPELTALVVGHHGSRYSTGQALLEATSPEYAFISVGENSYGHPADEVLERLQAFGCVVYRTDQYGTIIFRR